VPAQRPAFAVLNIVARDGRRALTCRWLSATKSGCARWPLARAYDTSWRELLAPADSDGNARAP
jgi:hypothetical protein